MASVYFFRSLWVTEISSVHVFYQNFVQMFVAVVSLCTLSLLRVIIKPIKRRRGVTNHFVNHISKHTVECHIYDFVTSWPSVMVNWLGSQKSQSELIHDIPKLTVTWMVATLLQNHNCAISTVTFHTVAPRSLDHRATEADYCSTIFLH